MMETIELAERYAPLTFNERLQQFYREFSGARVLVTTSMGNTSPLLLKMVSEVCPGQEVTFIDTGYHFEETLSYKNRLQKVLGLRINIIGPEGKHHQPTKENKLWNIDPDFCCLVNKVFPIRQLVRDHDVWVSGLLAFQNENRRSKKMFEQNDILKFYPILDMTEEQASTYMLHHDLPVHPLSAEGYGSVGCFHCTKKSTGREGRWEKFGKTECGLHV